MDSLEFRILGQLEIRRRNDRVDVGGRRQQMVLALLLIDANRVVSVDRLIDELWGEDPPSGSNTTLQSYISKLRRSLEPERPVGATASVLCTEGRGYVLRVDPVAIDARHFERLAGEGREAFSAGDLKGASRLFRDALSLWRGPALADFAFESFAAPESARLEELRLALTEDQLDVALALGQHRAVVGDLEQLVSAHPLRERLRGQLMLALYRSGRQAEALRAYQAGRQVLSEELGLEPSRALKALESAVLLQDPALDWVAPSPVRVSAAGALEDGLAADGGVGAEPARLPEPTGLRAVGVGPRSETVTFLLTDIEHSTRLWVDHPRVADALLARHEVIVRGVVAGHDGVVPAQGEGDSLLAVFRRASDAVAAALDLQRALRAESWPEGAGVTVRIGLHTGEAVMRDGNYFGLAVNRAGRLRGLAHGGQILCSQATAEVVCDHLPPGCSVRDLGLHRLRDLDRPEHVYQICHPDLPADFPSLAAAESAPHNLPAELTSFVGREREVVEVRKTLEAARLVTLTGAGGVGKTRLALQVAAEVVDTYPDGAWLADLAPLADPTLIPHAVAKALGVVEDPVRPLIDTLADHVRARALLLVLDNCEHLVADCAPLVEAILRAGPDVRVLATSREPLRVAGEVTWRVPSLSSPDPGTVSNLEALQDFEAVRLLLDRVEAARPGLAVRQADAAALAQICARLDGIPLALELAAARVGVLGLDQIAVRLEDRFRLLVSGPRTALSRHQTLRAAVDWSHELLSPAERAFFRGLSVFAGTFDLDAAEAVGSGPEVEAGDVLDLLDSLVTKSLVVMEPQLSGVRYRLLETIRQYAAEKLAAAAEEPETSARHLAYYLRMAEEAESEAFGVDGGRVLDRLEANHDNFRAALERSVSDADSREVGLRLAHALFPLWEVRDHRLEGRAWMEALLNRPRLPEALASAVARRAGNLAWTSGDQAGAGRLWERALELARAGGDRWHLGRALVSAARLARSRGEIVAAEAMVQESHALAREVGDDFFVAESLIWLAWLAHDQAHYADARDRAQTCRVVASGNWFHVIRALNVLGNVEREQGDYEAARKCFNECRALAVDVEDRFQGIEALDGLGSMAAADGHLPEARAAFEEALVLMRKAPAIVVVGPLGGLGELASAEGDHATALSLLEQELHRAGTERDPYLVAWALLRLGRAALAAGDPARAWAAFAEVVAMAHRSGMLFPMAGALDGLAAVDVGTGRAERAVQLCARAAVLRVAIGAPLAPSARPEQERTVTEAQDELGEEAFAAAWAEGSAASLDEIAAQITTASCGALLPPRRRATARRRSSAGPRERG